MLLTSGGNLLIGTTNDGGEKLQVAGTASFVNTGNGQIDITRTSGATTFIQSQTATGVIGTSTNHKLDLKTNGSTRLRITNGGNVLIGTTSDDGYKLNVNGIIRTTSSFVGENVIIEKVTAFNSNGIQFRNNAGAEKMRITDGGNVLIGTTTDSGYKLDVVGGVRQTANNPILVINNQGSSQTGTLYFRDQFGGATIGARVQTAGGALSFRTAASGDDNLIITSAGNANFSGSVSIGGTAGAVYKLDVVGKQRVQSVLELEDVLTLNAISTPADPQSGQSSIYMDSADGAIKVKINVGGTVVTRTIASFE